VYREQQEAEDVALQNYLKDKNLEQTIYDMMTFENMGRGSPIVHREIEKVVNLLPAIYRLEAYSGDLEQYFDSGQAAEHSDKLEKLKKIGSMYRERESALNNAKHYLSEAQKLVVEVSQELARYGGADKYKILRAQDLYASAFLLIEPEIPNQVNNRIAMHLRRDLANAGFGVKSHKDAYLFLNNMISKDAKARADTRELDAAMPHAPSGEIKRGGRVRHLRTRRRRRTPRKRVKTKRTKTRA
tara:strand:+ start:1201 stop:1929 length:729 start_codon:yes stop_codon:yes gene_type:complete